MMISSKGRYALRVMLDMAEQSGGGNIRLKDIAARQNISVKYLESIMTALCKSGLVESALGKDGGYRLRRAPEAYTAGEILRAAEGELAGILEYTEDPIEGELAPVSCLTEDGKKCGGVCTCYTLPFWRGLEEHINAYIDGYTLRDLLDAKRNTPVCGGTGDADTNSAEKKDTEQ